MSEIIKHKGWQDYHSEMTIYMKDTLSFDGMKAKIVLPSKNWLLTHLTAGWCCGLVYEENKQYTQPDHYTNFQQ